MENALGIFGEENNHWRALTNHGHLFLCRNHDG